MKQLTLNQDYSSVENYSNLIDNFLTELESDTNKNRQKILELCHVGKFLMFFENQYSIVKLCEEPDFLIASNCNRIGLEHQIIIDDREKEKEGYFTNLCKRAEKELKKDNTLPNFLANVYAHPYFKIKINDKQKTIKEICDLIRVHLKTGEIPENDIIDRIFSMDHSRISLCGNLGAWWQKEITEELITDAVKKKELRISRYFENTKCDQWLLLVIGGLGASSFLMRKDLKFSIDTKFDKIYVLEDFYTKLYELK